MSKRSHAIAAALWFVWVLALTVAASEVCGMGFRYGVLLSLTGLGLGVAWLAQLALAVKARSRGVLVFLAAEAIFVACGARLAGSRFPFRLRFHVSEAALTEYAMGRLHGGRAGLFAIQSVARDGEVVLLESGEGGFFSIGGMAYSPRHTPKSRRVEMEELSYRHLEGAWYLWTKTLLMD